MVITWTHMSPTFFSAPLMITMTNLKWQSEMRRLWKLSRPWEILELWWKTLTDPGPNPLTLKSYFKLLKDAATKIIILTAKRKFQINKFHRIHLQIDNLFWSFSDISGKFKNFWKMTKNGHRKCCDTIKAILYWRLKSKIIKFTIMRLKMLVPKSKSSQNLA